MSEEKCNRNNKRLDKIIWTNDKKIEQKEVEKKERIIIQIIDKISIIILILYNFTKKKLILNLIKN